MISEWEISINPVLCRGLGPVHPLVSAQCLARSQYRCGHNCEFLYYPEDECLKFPGCLPRHYPDGSLKHNYLINLIKILITQILYLLPHTTIILSRWCQTSNGPLQAVYFHNLSKEEIHKHGGSLKIHSFRCERNSRKDNV